MTKQLLRFSDSGRKISFGKILCVGKSEKIARVLFVRFLFIAWLFWSFADRVYDRDSFGADHRFSLSGEDSYLLTLNKAWNEALKEAFMNLPRFHWQERSATLVEAPPLAKRD